ncbi:O-antigen polymerase [Mycolicibacterium gilvum]|uniref:O-antigen polymerase n=1 Tax=Mycolicibacterium gilvum TaxID=1804 RepID=UPI0040461E2C
MAEAEVGARNQVLFQWILLVVACLLLLVNRSQGALSPVRMFLYGWFIVLITMVSGMISYFHPMATKTFALVLCTLCLFVAGAYFGRRQIQATGGGMFGEPRHDSDRITLTALCLLAVVGVILVGVDLAGGGASMIANFSSEAALTRNTYWKQAALGQDPTPIRSIRFYGVVACLAVATLLPYATRARQRYLQVLSVIAALAIVIDSLLSAARFSIGVLAICLLVSATLVYGAESIRRVLTVRRLLLGGVLGFYFFIVFPIQRNPDLAVDPNSSVAHAGDARIADWVNQTDIDWLKIFAYSTGYFSTALDKLNYFVTKTTAFSWNTMGQYNLPQFARETWQDVRQDIATIMTAEGWGPNPWATGIRDFGIDFGWFAILAAAVLGYLAQVIYDKSIASRSYVGLITATYVSVSCLIFAFLSPFQIRIIGTGFMVLAVIAIAHWLLTSKQAGRSTNSALSKTRTS